MIVRAWAIVCQSGAVHTDDDHCYVFLDKEQARDAKTGDDLDGGCPDDDGCGPHKVITLRGEMCDVRWPRNVGPR